MSPDAKRLLDYLRVWAVYPTAITDWRLAEQLRIPERSIVELAGELLRAGEIVIAHCEPPFGRSYVPADADLGPAREYLHSLRGRALAVLRRFSDVKRAIHQVEAGRQSESNGQLRMFP